MRQELIQQTQDIAAIATTALDSILALRAQLLSEIDNVLDDPSQVDRIIALDKQMHDIDTAIGQVRFYLLGYHRTLASAQAIAQGNIELSNQIVEKERPLLVVLPIAKSR